MRIRLSIFILLFILTPCLTSAKGKDLSPKKISPETESCISCHRTVTPGIVEDWMKSRHSLITPGEALKKKPLERRVSIERTEESTGKYVVGCYECHSLNPENHTDNFEHMGYRINVVVTPSDCKKCHPSEVNQFSKSKKAYAYRNLMDNPIYRMLVNTTTGLKEFDGRLSSKVPSEKTLHETCLGCHGTKLEVKGVKRIMTSMGELQIPEISNWPNQGVGRINPDGSLGSCTACHPRHSFSIEIARKPYTCAQCHLEPDVPAWNVYKESKHGNIFLSKYTEWNFSSVPWTIGKDFKAPTCATCHNSLLVSPDGKVIAERTHDFGSRLWVRLFGLIYAHPQPKSGDTTIIKNKDGLPLPVSFSGELASGYLIDEAEQKERMKVMKNVCNGCHNSDWVNGHFEKLDSTIRETNMMTLTATKMIVQAWEKGIEDKSNPFDEALEKRWVRQWLFYANSIRYASAMTGAPDYTAFKYGWWDLSENLSNMMDIIEFKQKDRKQ